MAMLSTEEAAKRMGLRPATLRCWRMQHIGPSFIKLSARCFRYDERDVDAYVNERRYDPSARASLEDLAHAHR